MKQICDSNVSKVSERMGLTPSEALFERTKNTKNRKRTPSMVLARGTRILIALVAVSGCGCVSRLNGPAHSDAKCFHNWRLRAERAPHHCMCTLIDAQRGSRIFVDHERERYDPQTAGKLC
eukprot:scaffold210636_cov28-Tisochrysis_lutea.AAC.1